MCIRKDILATLTYFNMFDYPLEKQEVFQFLQQKCEWSVFELALANLVDEYVVYTVGEYYALHNDYALVTRRVQGNAKAAVMLKKARNAASLISKFPFVRGVAVSGSLSKNFADDYADIDFFIITSADRLWLCRTCLHLFKKFTFLLRKQHFFCMNYFIDESQLCIIEKNIYTATEIATLIPFTGDYIFEQFYKANQWIDKLLPLHAPKQISNQDPARSILKRFTEKLFNGRLGNAIDDFFMKLTIRSWKQKTEKKKRNSHGVIMGMHAGKHFSKPDPANFQKKLLQHYENSLLGVVDRYDQLIFN